MYLIAKPITRVSDEGVDEHREGAHGLAPELVEAAAVEQAVDAGRGRRRGEEADRDGAQEATDEVDADDVERVVEAELVLQADGERAEHAGERRRGDRADGVDRQQDGVIATRPATTPEAAPSEVAWPSRIRSTSSQPSVAAPVATIVVDPDLGGLAVGRRARSRR